jgi:hypothetical protein
MYVENFYRSSVMSKQWEYNIQSLPTVGQPGQQELAVLNQLGKDGWELIHIVGQSYIFKREKIDVRGVPEVKEYKRESHQKGHPVG